MLEQENFAICNDRACGWNLRLYNNNEVILYINMLIEYLKLMSTIHVCTRNKYVVVEEMTGCGEREGDEE